MSTWALLGVKQAVTGNAAITTLVDVAVGDLILIFGGGNAAITASSITDSASGGSNTYTAALGTATGAPVMCGYRSSSVATHAMAAGGTITIDNSGGKTRQTHVAVVIKNPGAADILKAATGGTAAPSPGATGTLAQADEFEFVGITAIQTADPTMSGWTKVGSVATAAGSNDRVTIVYAKTVSSTTSTTPVGAIAAASNWASQLVTVKTVADTPPPPGYAWSLWDGTTETPLTLQGVWDGSAIVGLTIDTVI